MLPINKSRMKDTSFDSVRSGDPLAERDRLNIGIYIRTLAQRSPASTRFQETILEGLQALGLSGFHFIVFSDVIPSGYEDSAQVSYVALAQSGPDQLAARRRRLLLGGIGRRFLRLLGLGSSATYQRLTRWIAYEPAYYKQLRDLDIRIIWNLGVDVLPSFLPFAMVVWDCNYRIHPMFPEYSYLTDGYRFFDQHTPLLQSASYVIVGTEQGKQEVVDIFGVYPGKVRVIPFATPELPATSAARKPLVEGDYVFYPARLWPHKNHIALVRALALLQDQRGTRVPCVLSGLDNGNLAYVLEEAERLGVLDQITYLGNVSTEELADLYRGASALAYCSLVGPDNFPPLEAMSAGCPVVTADVPGAREQYGDAVLYFPPTDEQQLADQIWRILHDRETRERLVERGLERARRWTPREYSTAMLQVLNEFAGVARAWPGARFAAKMV
jgi:glycosyltransferase involved in cell wall biosynthesis